MPWDAGMHQHFRAKASKSTPCHGTAPAGAVVHGAPLPSFGLHHSTTSVGAVHAMPSIGHGCCCAAVPLAYRILIRHIRATEVSWKANLFDKRVSN